MPVIKSEHWNLVSFSLSLAFFFPISFLSVCYLFVTTPFSGDIQLQISYSYPEFMQGNKQHLFSKQPSPEATEMPHSWKEESVALAQSFMVTHSVLPPFPTARGTRNSICLLVSPQREIFVCFFLPNDSQIRTDFILNGFTMILQLKELLPSLLNPRWRVREGPFCWCSLRFHCALIQEKLRSSKILQEQQCDVSPASLHSRMPPVNGAIPRSMKPCLCQATFTGFGFPPNQPPHTLWIFLFWAFQ